MRLGLLLRRRYALLSLAAVPLIVAHCGNGVAPHPYNPGTSVVSSEDAGLPPLYTFKPQGCPYTVSIPQTRPFTSFSVDTATAPSDPSSAAPVRIRVGVGGGTTKAVASDAGSDGAASGPSDYADPTTTASFLWETSAATTNAKVRIGTSPGSFGTTQSGFVYTNPPPTAGFGSTDSPGYFHQVDLCGLTPATTYYYQVGGGAPGSEIWSATQSFATVPATGSSITVGVYGDARDTLATWQMVNERMVGSGASLLLISGDIVDIGVQESLFQSWLDAIWKNDAGATGFFTLGQFVMVPVPGNHENDSSQFFANFPIPGAGSYAKQYSSFDVGNTHFVLIDDEPIAILPANDPAVESILGWLDADLAAANADRARHPFIVEINHRGLYSTSMHAEDIDVIQARGAFAPLFAKYHVDLVLNGHDHEYERSKPLTAGNPASGAPVVHSSLSQGTTYVINAGAGADPYAVGSVPSDYREGNGTPLGMFSPVGYIGCYVLLTLSGTTLTLNAYGMKASGTSVADDTVIDTVIFGQ
jgi:acid phosphatase type 7